MISNRQLHIEQQQWDIIQNSSKSRKQSAERLIHLELGETHKNNSTTTDKNKTDERTGKVTGDRNHI